MYPDFLGIGAQKAGTSWLYKNLIKHPDIWLPPIKELHYFNYKQYNYMQNPIDKVKDKRWRDLLFKKLNVNIRNGNLENLFWIRKYFFGNQNDEWYASLFQSHKKKVAGEITPDYTALDESSVAHIYEIMPDVKIIFMLRNPIDRAWSYTFSHIKKDKKILESIPVEVLIKRCTSSYSRLRGNYKRTLEIWQSYYPEEQFFIGFFEEIAEDPIDLLHRICDFLSINFLEEYINVVDKRKVYSFGNTGNIPNEVRLELARVYREEIRYLSMKYGSYANQWLVYADKYLTCS
ncbi:MAG: sulfotransferase [Leptolyngbya sp. SIO1D8]|nr:sulfotransferase [Leptolyngbya sp. SIO1D8]